MQICFLCNEYPPGPHGGIGTMTQLLARVLVEAGHQVRTIGIYSPAYPAPDYEEDHAVRVWRLREPGRRLGWMRARLQIYRMIERWSKEQNIDLIEAPDYQAAIAGWRPLPVPVVVRLHGSGSYFADEMRQSTSRFTFWMERAALRRADFWCSVSRYTADKTKALFALRSEPRAILYNPVETIAETRTMPRSSHRVVFTGTLIAKKGIVPLVNAWPRVVEVCEDAELHIFGKDGRTAGGGSMQAYLESLLEGRARERAHFHGHVARTEILQALQTARVAVFPSYAEAFAVAPLEAMACGCPTIYSKRGSGPELIDHGRNGLLVDPDQQEQIAEAIIRLLTDDELARQFEYAGRERIRQSFSLPILLRQNEAFYQSCLREFHEARAA